MTTENREETLQDIILRVADGNIGALSILSEALKFNPLLGMAIVGNLDRIGLRGPQVWNLSKISGRDPRKLAELVLDEDSEIIRTLKGSEDVDWPTMQRLAASIGVTL